MQKNETTKNENASQAPRAIKFASKYSKSFPLLLEKLGISVAVSTYQSGKLILLRNMDGKLNTHYHAFERPMGFCVNQTTMYLGVQTRIIKFRNIPELKDRLDSSGKEDACYVPRAIQITGGIDIHEMEMDSDGELLFINTKFSALCKLDYENSFVPVWRPDFITALAAEDRCHLNGLCMVDGKPKYVTALGKTDIKGGWRENKRDGGILIDIDSNEIVLEGLSMPHSPRWYRDKLWILESGEGSIATVDLKERKVNAVAKVPGFTRGVDFIGPLAFIGLSQIRESADFGGLPITEHLKERICGVWVVNIETGETLGNVVFTAGVEEIFSVKILRHAKFPEVLNLDHDLLQSTFMIPEENMKDVVQNENT